MNAIGTMKDLLRTADLGRENLSWLLDLAASMKREPLQCPAGLRAQTVVLALSAPSTHTRIAFQTAVAHFGGTALVVDVHELQRGETIEDAARMISTYARALVIRTDHHDDVQRLAAAATISVVNAGSELHHPCQSIGDLLTLREELGGLQGRRLVVVGGGGVAHSLMEGCALAGMDVTVVAPPGYDPHPAVVTAAQHLASRSGSHVTVMRDLRGAVCDADAVYTGAWSPAHAEAFRPYRIDAALMKLGAPHAVLLHCLPAHRSEDVTAEVFDGPRSRVFNQAANQLPAAQAILYALITGALPRRTDIPAPPVAREHALVGAL